MLRFRIRTSCDPRKLTSIVMDIANTQGAALDSLTPTSNGWLAWVIPGPNTSAEGLRDAFTTVLKLSRSVPAGALEERDRKGNVRGHLLSTKLEVRPAEVTLLTDDEDPET